MELMFITNNEAVAMAAEQAGIDRIFVDLETIGKKERQGGMDTVQSKHTIEDIQKLRRVIYTSKLLVRINQIHEKTEEEIERVLAAGADIVMLPYFKTVNQVKRFIKAVRGRAITCLLFETPESIENIEEILKISGIDECYIGINDLHLGYGKKFMFELLADGTVEKICNIFKEKNYKYGFGGIARIEQGTLPAELVLCEHVNIGSSMVILARCFCDTRAITEIEEIKKVLTEGVESLRAKEKELQKKDKKYFEDKHKKLQDIVKNIVEEKAKE